MTEAPNEHHNLFHNQENKNINEKLKKPDRNPPQENHVHHLNKQVPNLCHGHVDKSLDGAFLRERMWQP